MSFTKVALYPANPTTVRGEYTKLSASKEKIVYTNGKTVFVSTLPHLAKSPSDGKAQIRDIAVSASPRMPDFF
jgi:hypothetical protein